MYRSILAASANSRGLAPADPATLAAATAILAAACLLADYIPAPVRRVWTQRPRRNRVGTPGIRRIIGFFYTLVRLSRANNVRLRSIPQR